ncbi:unnamed protein product, partial [marine sediment metagenome]
MKTHDKKNQTEMMIHFKNGIAEDIRPWGKFRSFPH